MAHKALNIYKLIDTSDLVDKAFEQPTIKIKPRSAKRPTLEAVVKAVAAEIQEAVIDKIAADVQAVISEAYEGHTAIYGEHKDCAAIEERDAWEEAADEMVEEAITPWTDMLSQNWLGVHTIASSLHLENGVLNFCNSLGKEYWKTLTNDPDTGKSISPVKILASANILQAELEARLTEHNNPTEKEKEAMANEQNAEMERVIGKMAEYLGKDFDAMTVYDDVDLASGDDEILANGAAPRLGLTEEDVLVLQNERLMHGDDIMDMVNSQIEAYFETSKKKPAAKKTKAKTEPVEDEEEEYAPAPVKTPKKVKVEKSADETEGDIDPTVLLALKECGATDNTIAQGIGVSRGTYNNYVNGKTVFEPNAEQASFIRGELVDRINKLHEALAIVDGTEPEVVF